MILLVILGLALVFVYPKNIPSLKEEWVLEQTLIGVLGSVVVFYLCFLGNHVTWIQAAGIYLGVLIANIIAFIITAILILKYAGVSLGNNIAISKALICPPWVLSSLTTLIFCVILAVCLVTLRHL
ncbi:hypothetical protein Pcinc_041615 [Petrolisthes cinctipes]|uniref:NADH dehydrogenase subunit 6 n=1 Tax=Petrolisthes cinctipes TaxID=88211 RepID=A0AAE1BMV7_PETCI|nr:hypothetical protein Pcinc_041615 [Petrolisthes cinctipes]